MKSFGWKRKVCFEIDQKGHNVWGNWFAILNKGTFCEGDAIPYVPVSTVEKEDVKKALQKCFDYFSLTGKRATDFIDWIGYAIGIAWCSEKPNITEKVELFLEEHFPWEGLIQHPADYMSTFLVLNGSSGNLEYYPTPMTITTAISRMLNISVEPNLTDSVLEPCLGPGAMLLPVKALNLVGMDLSLLMVKAACIQAFFYKPSLLFVPTPIVGIHAHPVEKRIHQYFEVKTDSRIYWGNSLFGEFQAPKNIFIQDSEFEDVYVNPYQESLREIHQYRDWLKEEWSSIDVERRKILVGVMAREHKFTVVMSNPPFGKMNALDIEKMKTIEKENIQFYESLQAPIDVIEDIPSIGQLQLF